jgi:apolipoprotein N-acyltransferase
MTQRLYTLILHAAVLFPAAFVGALSFPRTDWSLTPWVAVAPLLVVAAIRPPRVALGWGWAYGLLFFLVLLRWLNFTFGTYSAMPWPTFYGPTVLLAAYCAFWIGAVAWAVSLVAARQSTARALALAPFFWVAAEWLRGHLLGGFPWGTLGYSQYLHLGVIQIAELSGVHAVSFVLVAVNAAFAGCVLLTWRKAVVGVGIAGVLLAATLAFGAWRLAEPLAPPLKPVTIIQPAIEQPLKWEPRHTRETTGIYFALLRRVADEHPALIVWPETAAPSILRRDPPLLEAFRKAAASLKTPMLMGTIDAAGDPPRFRNTAFLITEAGIVGRYDKIHLVPFGEFVPLSGLLGFVRGWAEFIAELEAGDRAVVFNAPPVPFGVVICYEGIFPDLFRQFVTHGAQLMVNMTNDAWFGRTSGPEQHLAMYPFRAVEHRVSIVRAANTGVSAFIAPNGVIVRRLRLFERDVMTESMPGPGRRTLFTRVGDWLGLVSLAVTAASLAVALRSRHTPAAGSA